MKELKRLFTGKMIHRRVFSSLMAMMLVITSVIHPINIVPAYATSNWLEVNYQKQAKNDIELYVQAESASFEPGETITLDLFVQNNSSEEYTDFGISFKDNKDAFAEAEFILTDDCGEAYITEKGSVTDLYLAPGETKALQFEGTLYGGLDVLNRKEITFLCGGYDVNGEAVTTKTEFPFTVGLFNELSIDFTDGTELIPDENNTLEITIGFNDIGYYYDTDVATDSNAKVNTDSNADLATDSDADLATDSDADYVFDLTNVTLDLETVGVKLEKVKLEEASINEENGTITALVSYKVDEDAEAGEYFGTVEANVKNGKKVYQAQTGFQVEVEEVVAREGHILECEEGCTSEGCDCECHAKAREIIAEVNDLLAQAQTFTEETNYEVMYAVYDALFALPDEMDTAWDNGELTEAEYYYVQEIVNENAGIIIQLLTEVGFDPYAIMLLPANYTIIVGNTLTLTGTAGYNHNWADNGNGIISFNQTNSQDVTITALNEGTVTVTHTYYTQSYRSRTETYTIEVIPVPDKIKVYVYVGTNAGTDANGNRLSWADNEEFLELLGIGANTIDGNNYFPVGEIYLDWSYLEGKTQSSTQGAPLINTAEDWEKLLDALSEMNTDTLISQYGVDYSVNRGNKVPDYLSQAANDLGFSWGSQKTALFRWNMTTSYGFEDQTVEFHLDLRFHTKTISFITGNNDINSGVAQDGTLVDSRVYITGSEIQEPRNLTIPKGYQFIGYYEDPDFTVPWDGIGTPLNEDETVYIKITPQDNVIIYYKNVSGAEAGSLTSDSEGLNPETGVAKGSEARANSGYQFIGWYADEECKTLLSSNPEYIPTKAEATKWINGTTYYAKFEPLAQTVIIEKEVTGSLGDRTEAFKFTITLNTSSGEPLNLFEEESIKTNSKTIQLSHGETEKIENIPVGTIVTVTEVDNDYTTTYSIEQGSNKLIDESKDTTDRTVETTLKMGDVVRITFINDKNPVIDTGISMDTLPYILIMLAVIGGIAFTVIRKRKDDELD